MARPERFGGEPQGCGKAVASARAAGDDGAGAEHMGGWGACNQHRMNEIYRNTQKHTETYSDKRKKMR